MRLFQSARNVHHGKQHEDHSLDEGSEDHEEEDRERYQCGDEEEDDGEHDILALDVAEQPHGKRQGAGKMCNEFDDDHQWTQPPYRSHKMLEVLYSMHPNADDMGCKEDRDGH